MARVQSFVAQKMNGAARSALRARVEDVLDDLEELREDAKRLGGAAGDAARAEIRAAGARVQHLRDEIEADIRRRAKIGQRYVNETMREQPVALIGMAAGVGFLLGLAFSRRD